MRFMGTPQMPNPPMATVCPELTALIASRGVFTTLEKKYLIIVINRTEESINTHEEVDDTDKGYYDSEDSHSMQESFNRSKY